MDSFSKILSDAINSIGEQGYRSPAQITEWIRRLRIAASREFPGETEQYAEVRSALDAVYDRLIGRERIAQFNPGVGRFTLARIAPSLRAELDRRIMASAGLIRLNREAAIEATLKRFTGWSTSIPEGGSDVVDKRTIKAHIAKPTQQSRFEARRVRIDQGHKLAASLSEIVAVDNQALGGFWRSHWRQPGYNYREDHKERDQVFYVMADNWAMREGLMKLAGHQYVDDVTRVGEEPFCRCYMRWVTNLRDIPPEMLTEKGRKALAGVKAA